ncbi:hypothetical protein, partial [uncultured Maribacter sp.]|uniref:hypothetical protein n=1 Tax=uncultured Maribacter sp. TaxID=431308 RepID=UPI00260730D5
MKINLQTWKLPKINPYLFLILVISFSSNVFGQTATEDFDPIVDVFGGGFSGTGWANDSWVRFGASGNAGDVQVITTSQGNDNIGGNLLQLDDNDAGAYRLIDFSSATCARLTFDYDYDNDKEGDEQLLIQIDPENDGTYVTLQTITPTASFSPNPAVNVSILIPSSVHLGGANTRIQFITGLDNANFINEQWWIDNVTITINATPVVNDLADVTACDTFTLPAITGTN